jgi:hypothetical protein
VVYLGANVPLQDLDVAVDSTEPDLVISAAQTLNSAASLHTMSEFLVAHDIPLTFGGGIYKMIPATIQCTSGYYLGTDLLEVPNIIESLVNAFPSMPRAEPLSAIYPDYGKFLR